MTLLLVAAVLAIETVLGWSSRQPLLAETETQGLAIARLLARSAAFSAHVMSDRRENAIGEQMIVQASVVAHLLTLRYFATIKRGEKN